MATTGFARWLGGVGNMLSSAIIFPRDLGAVVCCHVFNGERSIRLVIHEDDGGWSFYCGEADHSTDEDTQDYRWISVGVLMDRDLRIIDTADLRRGFEAERESLSHPWAKKASK